MATNNNIHIDSQSVIDALAHARESVTDLRPIMADIGETVRSNIMLGFRETKSPDGINWAALKPSTIENRRQGSSVPLNDTGQLKASITFNASSNYVEIGTNKPYAALMNFGGTKAQFPNLWGNVPARQFMPTSDLPASWADEILAVVNHHLDTQ
jgi:phage virion morphogenesis protein